MHDRFPRLVALAGIGAGAALAAGVLLTAGEPDGDHPAPATIVSWYAAHDTAVGISALVCAPLFAFLFLFFTAGLRGLLRSGEARESTWSGVVGAAAPLVAVAILLMAATDAAISRAADGGAAETARAIYTAGSYSWLVWAAPTAALLVATGVGGLRTSTLPRPFAWLSALLGVAALTPAGIGVFLVMPLWLVAASVVLLRRSAPAAARSAAALAAGD
jgi:hypothetical protein